MGDTVGLPEGILVGRVGAELGLYVQFGSVGLLVGSLVGLDVGVTEGFGEKQNSSNVQPARTLR